MANRQTGGMGRLTDDEVSMVLSDDDALPLDTMVLIVTGSDHLADRVWRAEMPIRATLQDFDRANPVHRVVLLDAAGLL
jgi:hypothetical protein